MKPTMVQKRDFKALYDLPDEVRFCKKCVVSNQRPRIVFDEEGVCNACHWAERKDAVVDWDERARELKDLCDRFRRNDGRHDVLVPSSGGKDSSYVAHRMKFEYGMNPLTVTWAPNVYTDIGRYNHQTLIDAGLDNITASVNGPVHRRMTRICMEEMGDPFQPFIIGVVWFPARMAAAFDIPLVMDGENGEVEYGGDPSSEKPGFTVKDAADYWLSDRGAEHWLEHGFDRKDLELYMPPTEEALDRTPVERHFFSYYSKWVPQENYYYAVEHTGFQANPEGRSVGTYSKYASLDDQIDPFHYYFALLKFGIGRATSDAAHEVRDGHITREEAVQLVRRYDAEFPTKSLQVFLDYCEITEDHFWDVAESWRNENLWAREGNDWRLKYQVQ